MRLFRRKLDKPFTQSSIDITPELRKNDIVDLIGYIALILRDKEWTNFDDLKD